MSEEADRLDSAAHEVRAARDELHRAASGHSGHVMPKLNGGPRTWQGPAASRFGETTQQRTSNLRRAGDRLEDLARAMNQRAHQLREEERRRAEEAARSFGRR